MHCGVEWSVNRTVGCPKPGCGKPIDYTGQGECPDCHLQLAPGIPLWPQRIKWPMATRLMGRTEMDAERARSEEEYGALWRSWQADCLGLVEMVALQQGSRYAQRFESVRMRHVAVLHQNWHEIERFRVQLPERLARLAGQSPWVIKHAMAQEVESFLDGLTFGLQVVPTGTMHYLTRCMDFIGPAHSLGYFRAELTRVCGEIGSGQTPTVTAVRTVAAPRPGMDEWLRDLLLRSGFPNVQQVAEPGGGVLVAVGTRRALVQARRENGAVGAGAVRDVCRVKSEQHCTEAWILTDGKFGGDAMELAGQMGVYLVDGSTLHDFPRRLWTGTLTPAY